MRYYTLWIVILLCLLAGSCVSDIKESWETNFPLLGTNSSPRAVDLNGDHILDIVMGTGYNEFSPCPSAVIALDGKTGKLLWSFPGTNQMVGSPRFLDVNLDGVPDVLIGGRSNQLYAIDGRKGEQIWKYKLQSQSYDPLGLARFNFYDPQIIGDHNGDDVPDLLVANGGNVHAAANNSKDRYPGVIMILDSRSGVPIVADTVPDGGETYMSPLLFQTADSPAYILFGTGGETQDGSLYKTEYNNLLNQSLHNKSIPLAHAKGHGFVAPVAMADFNRDGIHDIVAMEHGGKVLLIDGKKDSILFSQHIPGTESSNMAAIGYFTDDEVPDVFSYVSKGAWPNNVRNYQFLLDGKLGKIVFQDSMGNMGFSSPLALDLTGDGIEEAIISVNDWGLDRPTAYTHRLVAINFANGEKIELTPRETMKNISSTPLICDLDGDGLLDLIYCIQANAYETHEFNGLTIRKVPLRIPINRKHSWPAYMGAFYNGLLHTLPQ